jgi:hypothetical protein
VSSSLAAIPVHKRRQLSATLGLFAVLLVAIGAVAATGADTGIVETFVAIAFVAAAGLAMTAWGVARSVQLEVDERRLDAAVEEAIEAQGSTLRDVTCGCGHDHDPDELHVTDDPCAHDGSGVECTHSCETCVLALLQRSAQNEVVHRPRPTPAPSPDRLRPSPTATRAERVSN